MSSIAWRPGASLATRAFFAARAVQEVETPHVVRHPVTDPQLANVRCSLAVRPGEPQYLHTSPEYHMKRLLAAGAPDIYQICRVFRDGELGPRHLPEFTLVEWYRRDIDYDAFVSESCELVATIGACLGRAMPPLVRRNYREAFLAAAGLDPLVAGLEDIRRIAGRFAPVSTELAQGLGDSRTGWLDLLLVTAVEPALRPLGLVVLDSWPAAQAALARLDPADPRVARRFEIYLDGMELANGYHELADADEQRERFAADRAQRAARGLAEAPSDPALIAALEAGLPDCCGIALGFDRLLMACLGLRDIREVVSFATPEGG